MLANITENWAISRIYDETNWAITKLYSAKDSINSFEEITDDIIRLVNKEDITFKNLSIQGLNVHHSVNVGILNAKIGQYLNIPDLHDLVLGGLLHDIGKLYTPKSILNKPTSLTKNEREIVSKHTTIGFEIISKISNNNNLLNIIKNHHKTIKTLPETVDLKNITDDEEILYPLICGISDITDAMLSFRSYKKPLSTIETKNELTNFGIEDIDEIFKIII